ncbi:MAG: cytochrome P450 [Polyangiales bacterium]
MPPTNAPLRKGRPVFGSMREFQSDPLQFFSECQRELGDTVAINVGPVKGVLLFHPDSIRQVLHTDAKIFSKKTRGPETIRSVVGEGLLTAHGDRWFRMRRVAQPAFASNELQSMVPSMDACAVEMLDRWQRSFEHGEAFDLEAEMLTLARKVVSRSLLGIDIDTLDERVPQALEDLMRLVNARIRRFVNLPLSVPTAESESYTKRS